MDLKQFNCAIAMNYKKAQSILEYALLITLILVALVGIQVYLKRANQGRLKSSIDQFSGTSLFSVATSNLTYAANRTVRTKDILLSDGSSNTTILGIENSTAQITDDFSGVALKDEGIF